MLLRFMQSFSILQICKKRMRLLKTSSRSGPLEEANYFSEVILLY